MEKRVGTAIIQIENSESVPLMNEVISKHSPIIIGRQGVPRSTGKALISLILEGSTDEIGSLTGQLGRISGIITRSVLLKSHHHDK